MLPDRQGSANKLRRPWAELAAALLLLCAGCAAWRVSEDGVSVYRPASLAGVSDDLALQSLTAAARASIAYYQRPRVDGDSGGVVLGGDRYDSDDLLRSAQRVVELIEATSPAELPARLAKQCRAYAAAEPARFTAYYEPLLAARRRRDERFRYPIYRAPEAAQRALLTGRFGRLPVRAEIDDGDDMDAHAASNPAGVIAALDGLGLELAWLDDAVARFFLHVQGSGRLVFEDGSSTRVGFAASNDASYRSVGALMLARGLLDKGNASAPAMRAWLGAHPAERDRLLFENPRYVFFRNVVGPGPIGALGVALVAGRSLATDPRFVPRGVLAFVRTRAPLLDRDGRLAGHQPLARFAFSHDAGAAIRGPARVDLFWGSGEERGAEAGYMSESGEFFVLVCGGPERSSRRNFWVRR